MAVLETRIDASSAEFAANRAHNAQLVADLRARLARVKAAAATTPCGGTRRAASCWPANASSAWSIRARRSWSCRRWPPTACTTTTRRRAGIVTGIGSVDGQRGRHRRQRRHRQRRHVLPDDGQKAPAAAGGRRAEPPAVHLPGGFRRRVSTPASRRFSRSRALRPDLFQPGQPVGARHRPGGGGHGLVHRRRRVRAGHERRDGHRQRHWHDLHRRAAAGQSGNRRGGQRRRPGRRRRPHAHLGRGRPLRRGRPARAGDHAAHSGQRSRAKHAPWQVLARAIRRATTRPSCTASCRAICARSSMFAK